MCTQTLRRKFLSLAVPVALCLTTALSSAGAAPQYRIVQLPSFTPAAINNSGQIAGSVKPNVFATASVCLWTPSAPNGTTGTLQTLGSIAGYRDCYVTGMNSSGEIVGNYSNGSAGEQAFRCTPSGGLQQLDFGEGITNAHVNDINDSGVIVGGYGGGGFAWSEAGGLRNLSALPPPDGASGGRPGPGSINSSGVIGGSIEYTFYWPHDYGGYVGLNRATYWDADGTPHNLGVPVDQSDHHSSSGVADVNDAGMLLIRLYTGSAYNYYTWTPGSGLRQLPIPSSSLSCLALNNAGTILGSYYAGSTRKPFICSNGVLSELDSLLVDAPGWTVKSAYAMNDRGQIAATATLNGSSTVYTVLLNPVPEPSSLLMLGTGLIGLVGFVLRRR